MASIIVVGSGFAGMSAAARLAKLRHDVRLLEADPKPGGRLRGLLHDGVVWHTRPRSVTLPGVFRDLFRKSGRPMTAILDLEPMPSRRHVFLHKGTTTTLDLPFGTRSAQHDAVMAAWGQDPWSPWLDEHVQLWDVARRHVFEALADDSAVAAVADRLDLTRSAFRAARRGLRHRQLEDLVNDRWRLLDMDPGRVPALWVVWHYVERNFGRWRFDGDQAGLLRALVQRLAERRVQIETQTPVLGVQMKFGRVVGVHTNTGTHDADVVVWASGRPLPGLEPHQPRPNTSLVGITLHDEAALDEEFWVHGRDWRLRAWASGPGRWVAQASRTTDVRAALAAAGVADEAIKSIVHLPEAPTPLPAETSGSGLDLELRRGWKRRGQRRLELVPRPALMPAPGLYIVGGTAISGSSLELTGMGTAAIAADMGQVPAVRPRTP